MNRRIRTALVAVSAIATLSFASAALAANTGSVSVWHTPQDATLINTSSSPTSGICSSSILNGWHASYKTAAFIAFPSIARK